jgi:hypothetical protein
MADNDAAPAGRKRVRRPSQLTSDARSSKEPARASSSRPTPAEKAEAQETIAEMKAAAVSPPILATRGRKAEPHIVACALAMQRGEKFAEIAADFGIRTDQSPQGVWVDSKLAQLRAYRQQQLAAEAEAACAEFRAVTQARWEADPEYDPDSLYDDDGEYAGNSEEHASYTFASLWAGFTGEQVTSVPDWCPSYFADDLRDAHRQYAFKSEESLAGQMEFAIGQLICDTEDVEEGNDDGEGMPISFVTHHLGRLEARQLTLPKPLLAFWLWSKCGTI